jgi:hypothetical protein
MLFTARSADNLLIGAGRLYLARVANNVKDKFRHVGNAPTIELTTADTKIQKFSSMTRARPLYAERLQRRQVTVAVDLDEFMVENVADFMQGKLVRESQAGTPITGESLEADIPAGSTGTLGGERGGAWYPVAKVGPIIVDEVRMGATVLTEGTDYEVDAEGAMIGILPGSVAVANGANDLVADYTPQEYANDELIRVRGGSESNIEVAGRFSPDPTAGRRLMLEWWRGAIAPDGAFGFISEEWSTMRLNIALQDDSVGQYGGSALYPTHKVTQIKSELEDLIT